MKKDYTKLCHVCPWLEKPTWCPGLTQPPDYNPMCEMRLYVEGLEDKCEELHMEMVDMADRYDD